jgi:hypothetical protein
MAARFRKVLLRCLQDMRKRKTTELVQFTIYVPKSWIPRLDRISSAIEVSRLGTRVNYSTLIRHLLGKGLADAEAVRGFKKEPLLARADRHKTPARKG